MKKPEVDPCCYGSWGSDGYRRFTSAGRGRPQLLGLVDQVGHGLSDCRTNHEHFDQSKELWASSGLRRLIG